MSSMLSPQEAQAALKNLQAQARATLGRVWSREELDQLESMLQSPGYKLYLLNLAQRMEVVKDLAINAKTWEEVLRYQGEYDGLKKRARFEGEISMARQAREEQEKSK